METITHFKRLRKNQIFQALYRVRTKQGIGICFEYTEVFVMTRTRAWVVIPFT